MIKRLEDFECLSGVNSPLLPIIYCCFRFPLGELDGAYIQYDENEKFACFFCVEGNSVYLSSCEGVIDYSELSSFFELAGIEFVTSDKTLGLSFENQKRYELLYFDGSRADYDEACRFLTPESSVDDYKIIHSVALGDVGEFENWYLSFSRKLNNGCSAASFLYDSRRAVSAVCVPFIFEDTAVISGVETLCDERKKGYGSRVISSVINYLSERKVCNIYLWCKNDKLGFYKRLGFKERGGIYVGVCKK